MSKFAALLVSFCLDFELILGSRMFYNTQEMLLRRKLEEQADLQQAIELQERRLMNLQLLDLKNHHHSQFQHGFSTASPVPSPTISRTPNNQALVFPVDGIDQEFPQGYFGSITIWTKLLCCSIYQCGLLFFFPAENGGYPISAVSELAAAINDDKQVEDYKNDNGNSNTKGKANTEESDLPERY